MSGDDCCDINFLRKDITWPDNKRLAINFNIAFEMWSPGTCSGVNPMGNVLSGNVLDSNAESYGRYNANAGCRRLFDIVESEGVFASIFTSGLVAENHADELNALSDHGHEIIGHGYAQDRLFPNLDDQQKKDNIVDSTRLIEQAIGKRPNGWVSARITSDHRVQHMLAQQGYQWHGDALDRDMPYLQRFVDSEVVAIPMTIDFNDLPHAMRFGRTPAQFVEMFVTTLDQLIASNRETLILDVIVHGHCFGRPAGAWAFAEIVKRCTQERNLWVTTRGQIYDYVISKFDRRG